MGWLGISFLAVGLLFSNVLVVILGCLVLCYLFVIGLSFLRTVEASRNPVEVSPRPREIETVMGQTTRLVTLVGNNTRRAIRIAGLKYSLAAEAEVVEERWTAASRQVDPKAKDQIEGFLVATAPGRFDVAVTLVLESPMRLFTHSLLSLDKVSLRVKAKDVVSAGTGLNLDALHDISANQMRRGIGTDLAGIRPHGFVDDLRRIDWNATARMGRLMVRDFYVESDPAVILMVELSARFGEIVPNLIEPIETLLHSIPTGNPVGLILYDKHRVIASLDPKHGAKQRTEMMRALSRRAHQAYNNTSANQIFRPYFSLRRELRLLSSAVNVAPHSERVRSFARNVLPFYRKAASMYYKRLRELGVIQAFGIVRVLSQPALVIVICTAQTDMDGLYEGAKIAATVPSRIVVALLNEHERVPDDLVSNFQRLGVRILQCNPEGLPKALSNGVQELGRLREIRAEPAH